MKNCVHYIFFDNTTIHNKMPHNIINSSSSERLDIGIYSFYRSFSNNCEFCHGTHMSHYPLRVYGKCIPRAFTRTFVKLWASAVHFLHSFQLHKIQRLQWGMHAGIVNPYHNKQRGREQASRQRSRRFRLTGQPVIEIIFADESDEDVCDLDAEDVDFLASVGICNG